MNQPNTPDDGDLIQPLNSASPISSDQASCPFYTVIPTESFAITNFALNQQQDIQAELEPDSHVTIPQNQSEDREDEELASIFNIEDEDWEHGTATQASPQISGDWVTEPDAEKQAGINSEFQHLLKLNQELRQANDDLYQQVETLTSQLTESEKALQLQKKRSDVTESILKEQAQEFSATQEQIQSLYQQLDTSQQNVQRQEALIETYRAQLEFSQQRLAQLERECALLQSQHQEQSQHLLHSENACKELRTRLMRQQRQTLQFKAALEKCLETSIPSEENYENSNQSHQSSPRSSHHLRKFKSLLTNAQPIKPWSASVDESDMIEDIWNDIPNLTPPWQEETNVESQSSNSTVSLEEQIDSVIQMFFNSQTETPTPEENDSEVISDIPSWEAAETPLENNIHQDTITVNAEISAPEAAQTNQIPTDDYWKEISQLTQIETLSGEGQHLEHDETGSPSPIVYPNRPTKKRDSLAAVELPKFN